MIKKIMVFILSFFSAFVILINSSAVSLGAINGLILCGKIIISSLFPFSVICIFLIKANIFSVFEKSLSLFSLKIFGIPSSGFFAMILSFIGGYPIGAKMIQSLHNQNKISENVASKMLYYCVNAGPAFILIAVGENVFGSKKAGIILLCAHLFSSLIMAIFIGRFIKETEIKSTTTKNKMNLSEAFVEATSDSCSAIISICSYVVLFSTIIQILKNANMPFLLYGSCPLLELTTGVFNIRNIYIIAALLGWGGFCVHFQIFSVCKSININKIYFFLSRIIHASLSVLILYLLLKIFPVSINTLSNNTSFSNSFSTLTTVSSLCFILSGIVLLFAVNGKNVDY